MGRRAPRWIAGTAALALGGCATPTLPQGAVPAATGPADVQAAACLTAPAKEPPKAELGKKPQAFELPPTLPGADAPPLVPPRFPPGTPPEERQRAIREAYPELTTAADSTSGFAAGEPVTLAALQEMALANSPAIRRAQADADAAYGPVIQAGLYPNPTAGYQADQWQPRQRTGNAGQQGAFVNQTIRFPGKLSLAQAAAGFDFLNARVAARRAEVDVLTHVRSAYFAALVAKQAADTNRALSELADEVYQLQLRQVAGGTAAGYEPLQLYAQAVQARNALTQSRTTAAAAWRQLAAAVGKPDLAPVPLAGRADLPPPALDYDRLKERLLAGHTDLLTARNSLEQAEVHLRSQRLAPYPDLQTNTVVQHDNSTGNNQFNLQLGVQLPVYDRNQGNILQAAGQVRRARENLAATANDLVGRLAEAHGRYQANRAIAENLRERVVPNLTRAYRALVRRYQVEPDKVGFADVVVAQQNVGQALQQYLTALDGQWRAVVDLAALTQQDDLYADGCPAPAKEPGK